MDVQTFVKQMSNCINVLVHIGFDVCELETSVNGIPSKMMNSDK